MPLEPGRRLGPGEIIELRHLEQAFIRRFAPTEATSRQDFLFDFGGVVTSWLDPRELGRCLKAYLELLEKASSLGLFGVERVLSASELMLGNLGRALRAGVTPRLDAANDRLADSIRRVLDQVDEYPAMHRQMDIFKRLEAIGAVLRGA